MAIGKDGAKSGDSGRTRGGDDADADLAPSEDTGSEGESFVEDESASPPPTLSTDEIHGLARRIEALLFVSARPLNVRRIAELLGLRSVVPIRQAAQVIRLWNEGRAFELRETAGGYQILTRPEYEADVTKLSRIRRAHKLTQGALETLAVIAYKQPITRAELDSIRGAASDHHLRNLGERGLIRVAGRQRDERTVGAGAAMYGTTTAFLDEFGLSGLGELPKEGDLGVVEALAKSQASETPAVADSDRPLFGGDDPDGDGPEIKTVEL